MNMEHFEEKYGKEDLASIIPEYIKILGEQGERKALRFLRNFISERADYDASQLRQESKALADAIEVSGAATQEGGEQTIGVKKLGDFVASLNRYISRQGEKYTVEDIKESDIRNLTRGIIQVGSNKDINPLKNKLEALEEVFPNIQLIQADLPKKVKRLYEEAKELHDKKRISRTSVIVNFMPQLRKPFKLGLKPEQREKIYDEFNKMVGDYTKLIDLFEKNEKLIAGNENLEKMASLVQDIQFLHDYPVKSIPSLDEVGAASTIIDRIAANLGAAMAFDEFDEEEGSLGLNIATLEEDVERDIKEVEKFFDSISLDPLSIIHLRANLNSLAIKGLLFQEESREKVLALVRQEFIEPALEQAKGTEEFPEFKENIESIFEEIQDNFEEMYDSDYTKEYTLPVYAAKSRYLQGLYDLDVKENETIDFLDAFVKALYEEPPQKRGSVQVANLPDKQYGLTRQYSMDRQYYTLAAEGKEKEFSGDMKKFMNKLSSLIEKTFFKTLTILDRINITPFYHDHPFKYAMKSSRTLEGSFTSRRAGKKVLRRRTVTPILQFFNLFKSVGSQTPVSDYLVKGKRAAIELARFYGFNKSDAEYKKILKEIASLIGYQLSKVGSAAKDVKYPEFNKTIADIYHELKIDRPSDIEAFSTMLRIIQAEVAQVDENDAKKLIDLGRALGVDEKETTRLNKALLEAHDMLKIMKGEEVFISYLKYQEVDDIIKMQEYLSEDNLDLTALEIENIVKAEDSYKSIGLDYGVSSEVVYKIKAHFR